MRTLKLSKYCATTGRHCDELALVDEAEILLDLTALGFVGPLFLVRMRAWLDYHAHRDARVTVKLPDNYNVRNYMSRMHLADGIGPEITIDLPRVRENQVADRLIPLTRIEASGAQEFDDYLGELLGSEDMSQAGYLAEVVAETAQEMVLNAVQHGANDVGAYLAAQRFGPNRCVIAVGDLGIGMAEHLRRGGQGRSTDGETIVHGMTDMVSGTGTEFRGRGYSVPFEVARQKNASRVQLRVRANEGWVEKTMDQPPRPLQARLPHQTGTWVEFDFAHADVSRRQQ